MAQKINRHQARNISERISKKAFEHLIDPLRDQLDALGNKAYDKMLTDVDQDSIDILTAANVLETQSDFCVEVQTASGQEVRVTARGRGEAAYIRGAYWTTPFIVDDDLYDKVVDLSKRVSALEHDCARLQSTLYEQSIGKAPNTVIKAWPEAEEIIRDVVGGIEGGALTTPLEALLAKFLPMLPAPQPEGATA